MRITSELTGVEEVRRTLLRIPALAPAAIARTAEDAEEYVEGEAGRHSKTGALVASIYLRRVAGGNAWDIGHDPRRAPHAVFVHWGTRPHVIRPKNKRTLRWATGGVFRFARAVQHPGYRGDAWMTRAAAMVPRLFYQHVRMLLDRKD